MKIRSPAKGKDSFDLSTKSNARSKKPLRNVDVHLHNDRYIQLEASSLDSQGQNVDHNDVEAGRLTRDVLQDRRV